LILENSPNISNDNSLNGAEMTKNQKILNVKETKIHLVKKDEQDYISLTDMAKSFGD